MAAVATFPNLTLLVDYL